MQLKRLVSLASLCFIVTHAANAQNYTGTYLGTDQTGATVTLVLQQDAQGLVTGSFAAGGLTFRVRANIEDEDLLGAAVGDAGALYLEAYVEGGEIFVLLAEIGPGNEPDSIVPAKSYYGGNRDPRRLRPNHLPHRPPAGWDRHLRNHVHQPIHVTSSSHSCS